MKRIYYIRELETQDGERRYSHIGSSSIEVPSSTTRKQINKQINKHCEEEAKNFWSNSDDQEGDWWWHHGEIMTRYVSHKIISKSTYDEIAGFIP